eukprot:gene10484-14045_t
MPTFMNDFAQPIGAPVPGWTPRPQPTSVTLAGRHCLLEPLQADRHAADLDTAYRLAPDPRAWTYMFTGPFNTSEDYLHY